MHDLFYKTITRTFSYISLHRALFKVRSLKMYRAIDTTYGLINQNIYFDHSLKGYEHA